MACPFRIVVGLAVLLMATSLFFVHFLWDKDSYVSVRVRMWLLLDNWLVYVPMPQSFRDFILIKLCPDVKYMEQSEEHNVVLTAQSQPQSPTTTTTTTTTTTDEATLHNRNQTRSGHNGPQLTSIQPDVSQCPFFASKTKTAQDVTNNDDNDTQKGANPHSAAFLASALASGATCPFLAAFTKSKSTTSVSSVSSPKSTSSLTHTQLELMRKYHPNLNTRPEWRQRSLSYKLVYVSLIALIVWLHIELFCKGCITKAVISSVKHIYNFQFDDLCLSCTTPSNIQDSLLVDPWLFE